MTLLDLHREHLPAKIIELWSAHGELPDRVATFTVHYGMANGARCCRYCAMVDGDVVDYRPNPPAMVVCDRCGEPFPKKTKESSHV